MQSEANEQGWQMQSEQGCKEMKIVENAQREMCQ